MLYCSSCSTQSPDAARFCRHCGQAFNAILEEPTIVLRNVRVDWRPEGTVIRSEAAQLTPTSEVFAAPKTAPLGNNLLCLVFLLLAGTFAGIIWLTLPHDREVKSLTILLFKLLPFVFATLSIAYAEVEKLRKYRLHTAVIPIAFLVFFCFFVPMIFFYSDDYPTLYYLVLTATPFIILSLVLAYRLGGGSFGQTIRLSFAMLLLMLSGLEDLAFLTINHQTDPRWVGIPAIWTWASHISVFLGHAPTKYEAFAFIAVHVFLALLVLFFPTKLIARAAMGQRTKTIFSKE